MSIGQHIINIKMYKTFAYNSWFIQACDMDEIVY